MSASAKIVAIALALVGAAPSVAADLDARLERLVERLEERRRELRVPGLAIAVVKDDEMVLARGLGVADVERDTPVTPETIFAIGSSTKAFTATIAAMLVDEGHLDWDDPISKHLPWFAVRPDADGADVEITVRDTLCHRTGFARMGVLWAAGNVPRRVVLETAAGAEPWAKYAEGFHYNNVMYLAAGMASVAAAGSDGDWDALVAERLLRPLGMDDSGTSVRQAQTDPRLALGYLWEEEKSAYRHLPMRVLDTIAPAGAINSNVLDMARWVRFQLARGVFDGRRLVSEAGLGETWTRQIAVGGDVGYGLGWMLRTWQGQPVVEHGGNIDGFSAQVALLPESGLGFVLLMNVSASPLQAGSLKLVWETLLGPDEPAADAAPAVDFAPYLGAYVANFGSFRDQRFTVLVQNDRLAVDVPGQMVYELDPPDAEGRWTFALTDAIAVSFDRDETEGVVGMRMYQADLEFELPREGVEIGGATDEAELQKYLGTYRSAPLGMEVAVLVQSGRLAVDVPGQMAYELHPPDEGGHWRFRVTDAISVVFTTDDSGTVTALTMHQAGQAFEMPRTHATGSTASLTLEEIETLRGAERRGRALRDLGVFRLSGRVRMVHAGVVGHVALWGVGTDRHRQETTLGPFGGIRVAIDGERGWSDSSFAPFEELEGRYLEQARTGNPGALFGPWRDTFDTIEVQPDAMVDGHRVLVVKLRRGELPAVTAHLDPETGDVLRAESAALLPGVGQLRVVTEFGDYRDVHGVRVPFRMSTTNDASGRTEVEVIAFEADLRVEDGGFTLSPPGGS